MLKKPLPPIQTVIPTGMAPVNGGPTHSTHLPHLAAPLKGKIEIPKFKSLLKMINDTDFRKTNVRKSNTFNYPNAASYNDSKHVNSTNSIDDFKSHSLSTFREIINIDLNLVQTPAIHAVTAPTEELLRQQYERKVQLDPKTQRVISYHNLAKTTRERFKKNLIDFMNKQREDKKTKKIGYRFPVMQNNFRLADTTLDSRGESRDDEERMHIYDYSMKNRYLLPETPNSRSLPVINEYNYNFNRRKPNNTVNDQNSVATPLKLPNIGVTSISQNLADIDPQRPFTTDKSLKEDSLFWSKYKTTINRRMKNNQPNGGEHSQASSYDNNRISSIIEEDNVSSAAKKHKKFLLKSDLTSTFKDKKSSILEKASANIYPFEYFAKKHDGDSSHATGSHTPSDITIKN